MRNIKLTMEYDGSRYKGWQQSGKSTNTGTISEKLLDVLTLMTGEEIELYCAARTESGVHALAQTANFKTNCSLSLDEIQNYLNHYLPQDIVILSTTEVPERFHAGLNAKSQTYLYRISFGKISDVFQRRYVCHLDTEPDLERMKQAIPFLLGKHDFSPFSSGKKKKGTEKEIFSIVIIASMDEISFLIKGNNFLHNMPRAIVSVLLDIGYGIRPVNCISKIFCKEETVENLVPPHALYLKLVEY